MDGNGFAHNPLPMENRFVEMRNESTANDLKNFFKSNINLYKSSLRWCFHLCLVLFFMFATNNFYRSNNQSSNTNAIHSDVADNKKDTSTKCDMQWCNGYGMFLILFVATYTLYFYYSVIKKYFGQKIENRFRPIHNKWTNITSSRHFQTGFIIFVVVVFFGFLLYDTTGSRHRLQGLVGIVVLFAFGFVFSKHRSRIQLRPIVSGFFLQFLLAVVCLRWGTGRLIFKCIGDKIQTFLDYSLEGSAFVYGNLLVNAESVFVFRVLSVLLFFSFIISILYYLGIMQVVVLKIGWLLQLLIGTTVCESLVAAANIFLGLSESPLLIQPYIKHLTYSELHTIQTSGFATVAGTLFSAYALYGAEPANLITSTVMAAPGALYFSKLFYPETEESKTKSGNIVVEKSSDDSLLDAATSGATMGMNIILAVVSNLVAIISLVAFLNGVISWLGTLVGVSGLSMEFIVGKFFIPLAWVLGVQWDDCENVAQLIATKTIINEFVAFQKLGKLKSAGALSYKSTTIATYAICGFGNPCSVGTSISLLSTLGPENHKAISSVAVRAVVAGCIVCFLSACLSGLLLPDELISTESSLNTTITLI